MDDERSLYELNALLMIAGADGELRFGGRACARPRLGRPECIITDSRGRSYLLFAREGRAAEVLVRGSRRRFAVLAGGLAFSIAVGLGAAMLLSLIFPIGG